MAILTVGGVIARVQALLDDPAGARFSADYLRPYVDQENEELQIMLERLGVQQEEAIAIFNIPVATAAPNDLTPYFAPGQPLQYLMRPKRLDWKIQGQPDTAFAQSQNVNELNDVIQGNIGCQQYRWAGGAIQTTPSWGAACTLRVYFWALSQTVYDSAAQVMRGIGSLLALQTACFVCALNNGMGKLGPKLDKNLSRNKQNFTNLIVMQGQAENKFPRGTKRGSGVTLTAGGSPYF
jgi:hypothetical protein